MFVGVDQEKSNFCKRYSERYPAPKKFVSTKDTPSILLFCLMLAVGWTGVSAQVSMGGCGGAADLNYLAEPLRRQPYIAYKYMARWRNRTTEMVTYSPSPGKKCHHPVWGVLKNVTMLFTILFTILFTTSFYMFA